MRPATDLGSWTLTGRLRAAQLQRRLIPRRAPPSAKVRLASLRESPPSYCSPYRVSYGSLLKPPPPPPPPLRER